MIKNPGSIMNLLSSHFMETQLSWFEILDTPPRPSEIRMKNWRVKVKPVLTPHL